MNMFQDNGAKTPKDYIDSLGEKEKNDVIKIHDFIQKILPDLKPTMVSGMIGYGLFPYKTKSGPKGEWPLVSLSSRKNYTSIYVCAVKKGNYLAEEYKDKLNASIGKSCVRFKKIEDIDWKVLEELLKEADELTKEKENAFFVN